MSITEEAIKKALSKARNESANNDVDISLDEINSFGDNQSLIDTLQDVKKYNEMLNKSITFINPTLTGYIPFTMENLYLICAYSGSGKCFSRGTKILMFDGSVKNVEDIKVGDLVMGADSTPRNVLSLGRGREMMYDIIPTKGDKYTVNESHILSLKMSTTRKIYKDIELGDIVNISVKDYLKKSKSFHTATKGWRTGVEFNAQEVPLDPYWFGYWLGNGSSEGPQFATMDQEVVDYTCSMVDTINQTAKFHHQLKYRQDKRPNKALTYNITTGKTSGVANRNVVRSALRKLNVLNNKHIPDVFKINSTEIRLQVLAGLIDSDGGSYYPGQNTDICFKNQRLANDTVFLLRSLGFAAYISPVKKKCHNSKHQTVNTYYRISISGHLDKIPTKIKRKQFAPRKQIKNVLHTGITVKPVGVDNYYGFTLDGDHLFLLSDFTVVHNTTIASNVSHPLWQQGKKSLILSNEEPKHDILFRIGCLELGPDYNFNDWKKGRMPVEKQLEVTKLFPDITKCVKIIDVNYKNGFTTKLEGIKNALEQVKSTDYSCVMIDYFQLIQYSIEYPHKKRYDVLTDLWIWMRQYIKQSSIPIVLFAQLHSIGKRGQDMDSRIKECPAVYEAATVVLEVIPNFETRTSDFIIHKDRFGFQGKKMTCMFKSGKYADGTPEEIQDHANQARLENLSDQDFKPKELVEAEQEASIKKLEEKMLGKQHSDMLDKARQAQEDNR